MFSGAAWRPVESTTFRSLAEACMDPSKIAARWSTRGGNSTPLRVVGRQGDSTSRLPLDTSCATHLMPCLNALRRRVTGDADAVKLVDQIEAGVQELGTTLSALLSFTSGRKPKLAWVNLRQIVDDVCASLRARVQAQHVETNMDVPS